MSAMPTLLTVVAHIRAQAGKEDELRQALLGLVDPTRKEDGCVQYDLHEETGEPGRFVFYENWTSREHLDRHLATPHLTGFAARVSELCSEPPQILTYTRIA
jgi:quinol monooxygenase YgiN